MRGPTEPEVVVLFNVDSTTGFLTLNNCGTQNRAVFWPFGKRLMELLILDKKERVAESQ